ncbi:glycoside hydrolase family 31 protein [Paucibacter sp. Y2R2-4]|uniref:glycoside hydrolase family 31 protein n=1 Tax=Paucibacter sp. Y2R2-4 TaxID=2893553 RepID=UPI0021E45D0E|nr:glycoside hydrolase family 31 protein [Paucibacter sp. Y2R2-4]MCV2351468.1 glycoside hydrolase family 31 protein [Paucibacter sp. Y2R2-4]
MLKRKEKSGMTLGRFSAALGLGAWLFLTGMPASAALRSVGAVLQVKTLEDGVELRLRSGARAKIGFVTPEVLRVRISSTARFEPDASSYALSAPPPRAQAKVQQQGNSLELRSSSGVRVLIRKSPEFSLAIYDAAGRLISADDPARPTAFDAQEGAFETSKRREAYELYYGFGEKALPLSRHQQHMVMWNADVPDYAPGHDPSYQSIPFFIALNEGRSHGLFFNNSWRSWFDMGKTEPQRYRFGSAGGELDYFVFTGGPERSPARVLSDYTALTGRGALPPLWALGYQQSRWSYKTQDEVLRIAREFRQRQIPADVLYLDIDHMDGFRVFTWNPQTFAQPAEMLSALHQQGFRAVTIVDPGIKQDEGFAIYRSGRDAGVFMRNADGSELHAKVWPGVCAFPDFTSAQARDWFGRLYAAPLDLGVDGFWNDMNEPGVFAADGFDKPAIELGPQKTLPLDARHAGDGQPGSHARYHNAYGMQMARASFEGLRQLRPEKRPMVLTRAGFAGVQRYAAVWTGDNSPTWTHLALSLPMLSNLSISGVPFVGADVGGFMGSPSAELYTRWLQAAVLTPYFRTHSNDVSAPREPWAFGPEFEAINRATIELRYRLLPHLYSLFEANERSGLPPMRPLWFAYPHDTQVSLIEDQFLLGADLLVAPVLQEGKLQRQVYFPKGDAWIDWWDGRRYEGGSLLTFKAPLNRLPLFIRAGASVPTQAVVQHTGDMPRTPLTLTVALGAAGSGEVFQDAGEGYGYRQGQFRRLAIRQERGSAAGAQSWTRLQLDIPANAGFQRVAALEFIGLEAAPAELLIDGHAVSEGLRFDASTRRLHLTLPHEGVKQIQIRP